VIANIPGRLHKIKHADAIASIVKLRKDIGQSRLRDAVGGLDVPIY
jgi:hypothetical protein